MKTAHQPREQDIIGPPCQVCGRAMIWAKPKLGGGNRPEPQPDWGCVVLHETDR